jgi:oxygen-independent coproporphyrinogen III oxidase
MRATGEPTRLETSAAREISAGESATLSLYVHLPFCSVKCSYCAFAVSTDLRFEERYLDALRREIETRATPALPLESLYFGGGTPSRLSPAGTARLAEALEGIALADGAEVTLEANPEDVRDEAVARWIDRLRVNRFSLGVQSFHDDELRPLGRQHGREGALHALRILDGTGCRTSIDLIVGLPSQTVASVGESVDLALDSGTGHLSLYMLDLEPGSALEMRVAAGLLSLPDDGGTAAMYREVVRRAIGHGLHQYEVSNFAVPGEEAVHNRRYWRREPYVGVGLGAHSFDGSRRSANTRDLREYLELMESRGTAVTFEEILSEEEVRRERLLLALRQSDGLPLDEFLDLAGEPGPDWIEEGREEGWLEEDRSRVYLTIDGFLVSNELISRLM